MPQAGTFKPLLDKRVANLVQGIQESTKQNLWNLDFKKIEVTWSA